MIKPWKEPSGGCVRRKNSYLCNNCSSPLTWFIFCACDQTDEPYRLGYESWLVAEMFRILVLTSTVGFFAAACHVKMLFALIISLAFLAAFLYARPYRKGFHNGIQALAMMVPIVGMAREWYLVLFRRVFACNQVSHGHPSLRFDRHTG